MDIGPWGFDLGSLAFGLWSLISDHWSLASGLWSLVTDHWSLAFGLWSLADMHACREGYIDMKYPARVKVNAQGVLN